MRSMWLKKEETGGWGNRERERRRERKLRAGRMK